MSFLTVQNLTATYGVSQALFGVDLTMAEGEVTALMGRNGMGKSTTVKAICQMIRSEGTLTLSSNGMVASLASPVIRYVTGKDSRAAARSNSPAGERGRRYRSREAA